MIFWEHHDSASALSYQMEKTKTLKHETTNNHHTIDARLSHYDGSGEMWGDKKKGEGRVEVVDL